MLLLFLILFVYFRSADDLVAIYQFLLIKSGIRSLPSQIHFVRTFLGDSFNNGEIDYCLTTIEVSLGTLGFLFSTKGN